MAPTFALDPTAGEANVGAGTLAQDDVKALILKQGAIAQNATPAQWGAFHVAQKPENAALAKRLGIEVKD